MKTALTLALTAALFIAGCETTGQLASQQAVEAYVDVSELDAALKRLQKAKSK